jgi:hypothetical protein
MIPYRKTLIAAVAGFAFIFAQGALAQDEESADDEDEAPADSSEEEASDDAAEGEARDDSEESEPESEPAEKEAPAPEEPPPAPARGWARLWLGIAGTLDFVPMPSGTDLCMLSNSGVPLNNVGVYCTNPDGSDFPSRRGPAENDALVTGEAGRLDGGFTDGNLRILISADYAPTSSFLIGIRAGYAFNGYTGSAVDQGFPGIDKHLHAELRATYLFGSAPMTRVGFAPMVFLAGGASEFAAHVTRFVNLEGRGDQPVNLWVVRGPWFVAAGAGVRYQFSPRVAFNAALRLNAVFGDPSVLFATGPDLGVAYGF